MEGASDLPRVSWVVSVDLDLNYHQDPKMEDSFSTEGFPACKRWTPVHMTYDIVSAVEAQRAENPTTLGGKDEEVPCKEAGF